MRLYYFAVHNMQARATKKSAFSDSNLLQQVDSTQEVRLSNVLLRCMLRPRLFMTSDAKCCSWGRLGRVNTWGPAHAAVIFSTNTGNSCVIFTMQTTYLAWFFSFLFLFLVPVLSPVTCPKSVELGYEFAETSVFNKKFEKVWNCFNWWMLYVFYVPLAYILHLLDSCKFSKHICFPGQFWIQRDSMPVTRDCKLYTLPLFHVQYSIVHGFFTLAWAV
jgi:hypothetical protein